MCRESNEKILEANKNFLSCELDSHLGVRENTEVARKVSDFKKGDSLEGQLFKGAFSEKEFISGDWVLKQVLLLETKGVTTDRLS